MRKQKKEKKKWSRKKKLILYPIISFVVIIALLSACTAAGFVSVEQDVTNKQRQKRYIEVFDNVLEEKEYATIVDATDKKAFTTFTEIEEKRGDKDGYTVKMEAPKFKDAVGDTYKAKVYFWINKDMKKYVVDSSSYKLIRSVAKEKEKKEREKTPAEDWNSAAHKVTDDTRFATYETALQTALIDSGIKDLKFPWSYKDYEATEKKYLYKNKKGYIASMECSKISVKGDQYYHTGRIVIWVNSNSMEDLKDHKITLLEFDGETLIKDNLE